MTGSDEHPATDRTRLRRARDRGCFDTGTIHAILAEGLVAHVGLQNDHGPIVLPMAYARVEDQLYLHGAASNALLAEAGSKTEICVTVTLLDGLVLARSWFHHSMNYRCVVIMGVGRLVTDPAEKLAASTALIDHVSPGRTAGSRPPTDAEMRRTTFVALGISETSAKIRTGGPHDEPEDLALPFWAGTIPVAPAFGQPVPDAEHTPRVAVPRSLTDYQRKGTKSN